VLAGSKDPSHRTSFFATVAGRTAAGLAGGVIRKIKSGMVGISSRPYPTFKRVFLGVVLALKTRLKQGEVPRDFALDGKVAVVTG
jgi:hypothetical protein